MSLPEPDPGYNLVKLVDRMLPGYCQLMPYEYHVGPLLRSHGQCIDLAFLEAVWRYSRKLGEKRFPCGDFADPATFVAGSGSSSSSGKVGDALATPVTPLGKEVGL